MAALDMNHQVDSPGLVLFMNSARCSANKVPLPHERFIFFFKFNGIQIEKLNFPSFFLFHAKFHTRNPRRILEKARFLDEKALLRQSLLVVGQKKCAFSIPDIIQAIK